MTGRPFDPDGRGVRAWFDLREPGEQGAVQTVLLWQWAAAAIFLLLFPRDLAKVREPVSLLLGMIGPGSLGTAAACAALFLADASQRRLVWGWPVWEAGPWLGAAWQIGKFAAFTLAASAVLWVFAQVLGFLFRGPLAS